MQDRSCNADASDGLRPDLPGGTVNAIIPDMNRTVRSLASGISMMAVAVTTIALMSSSPAKAGNAGFGRSRLGMRSSTGLEGARLAKPGDVVILLHGLARSASMWTAMESKLASQGLAPLALDYPSRNKSLEALADSVLNPLLDSLERAGVPRVHFVTQSMGAILLRTTLARHGHTNLGGAVMIAPPNQGSEVATLTTRLGYGKWMLGPNLERLSNTNRGFFDSLGPARIPTGVIAGDRTWNFLNSLVIPGDDDGKVAVASTHLLGEADWLLVHQNHTFLHSCDQSLEQTVRFLTNGKFGS